ncbi:hypothetical protein [Emcibacter nanhaiensis]|uniref:Uncharacterized protein n=1 Tax=Emcibacter nanhaiensis TaxID=1505037 RepID=A0A501PTG9_9PROT|nr:hypothetical protein [Emcibacter nanhaiensis]TPD63001.1 hypothetical protein FIV46_02675 [Emcibacter nanhaiensis]
MEEVEGRDSAAAYSAQAPEPEPATVLTPDQFYETFKGCFSGLQWIVNKRLEPQKIELTSLAIQQHEEATARGLADEIYKLASEPGSPISWMIAPPTKYGPVMMLGFTFFNMKRESVSEELRAIRAKNVTPEKPEPEQEPEEPEEQKEEAA